MQLEISNFGMVIEKATGKQNKISNIMRVPISYGPREKFLARINQNLNQISSISDYIDTTDICMKDIMTFVELKRNKKKNFI